MALLMKQGDYAADGNGGVAAAQGGDELICEVLFRLTARRGSFPFLPGLGSRMGRLRREKPSAWDSLARQFAVDQGIFAGSGTMAPDGQPNMMWEDLLTREQCAQVLYRFAQKFNLV